MQASFRMKNVIVYIRTILVFVFLDIVVEMACYALVFHVPAPPGFGFTELILQFLIKILFDSVFVLMFRLAAGSRLARNGVLYGLLWFLAFSVPQEIGFWLVFKYEVVTAYAGLLSGLVTFPTKGWIVKRIKLP